MTCGSVAAADVFGRASYAVTAAGALRVRRVSDATTSSATTVAASTCSEMGRERGSGSDEATRTSDESRLKLSEAERTRRGAAAVWAVAEKMASATWCMTDLSTDDDAALMLSWTSGVSAVDSGGLGLVAELDGCETAVAAAGTGGGAGE